MQNVQIKRIMSAFLAIAMVLTMINISPIVQNEQASAMTISNATFTVTFSLNGGTGTFSNSTPAVRVVTVGERISQPSITDMKRDGFVFGQQWYTEASYQNQWNFQNPVTRDMTLYAWWRPLLNITFHRGEIAEYLPGTSEPEINASQHRNQVVHGNTIPQPTAPKAMGYVFDRWFADAARTIPYNWSTPVTEPTTLFARWLPANNVIFDLNYTTFPLAEGETPLTTPAPLQIRDNELVSPQPQQPSRAAAGWIFGGG